MIKYDDLSHEDKLKLYKEVINTPGKVIAVPSINDLPTQIPPKMTLLQWYVGMALNGLVSHYALPIPGGNRMMINPTGCSAACLDFAEYLIKKLEDREKKLIEEENKDA